MFLSCLCGKLNFIKNLLYLDLSIGFLHIGQPPKVSRHLHAKQSVFIKSIFVLPTEQKNENRHQGCFLKCLASNCTNKHKFIFFNLICVQITRMVVLATHQYSLNLSIHIGQTQGVK